MLPESKEKREREGGGEGGRGGERERGGGRGGEMERGREGERQTYAHIATVLCNYQSRIMHSMCDVSLHIA